MEIGTMTFARARDCLFLAVGLGGLVYQQLTETYNATLVAAYLALLSSPGLAGAVTLIRSGLSQPSPPPPPPSPPLSSSTASKDGGDQ